METTQVKTESSAPAAVTATAESLATTDIGSLSLAQMDTLMSGGSLELPGPASGGGTGEAVTTATEATGDGAVAADGKTEGTAAATEVATEGTVVEGATGSENTDDDAAAAAAAAAPADDSKARRIRVKDPIAQAALELYKAFEGSPTPISLAEAERRVKGEPSTAVAPEPVVKPPATSEVVATLETEVTTLESELIEAAEGGLYNKDIAQKQIDLADRKANLALARRDLETETAAAASNAQTAEQQFNTARQEAFKKAVAAYPDANDKETVLGAAVEKRFAALRDPSHVDHAKIFTASAPLDIAREVADELGIAAVKPAAAAAATPVTSTAKPVRQVMSPVSGAAATAKPADTTSTPAVEAEKVMSAVRAGTVSLEELDRIQGGGGVNIAALIR